MPACRLLIEKPKLICRMSVIGKNSRFPSLFLMKNTNNQKSSTDSWYFKRIKCHILWKNLPKKPGWFVTLGNHLSWKGKIFNDFTKEGHRKTETFSFGIPAFRITGFRIVFTAKQTRMGLYRLISAQHRQACFLYICFLGISIFTMTPYLSAGSTFFPMK